MLFATVTLAVTVTVTVIVSLTVTVTLAVTVTVTVTVIATVTVIVTLTVTVMFGRVGGLHKRKQRQPKLPLLSSCIVARLPNLPWNVIITFRWIQGQALPSFCRPSLPS